MNAFDRRRVLLACVLTLVALPLLWLLNRGAAASGGSTDRIAAEAGADTAPPTTRYVPSPPLFVGGDDAPTPPGLVDIAVPPAPSANSVLAKASFHRYVGIVGKVCTTMLAPDAAVITVTNVDNGQTVTCTNTLGMAVPGGVDIVIDTALFVLIGDLADAPVPVRMSW